MARGERAPAAELLRWFVDADGQLWPDWTGRAKVSGRTVHTAPDAGAVLAAARSGAFERGLRRRLGALDSDALVARARDLGVAAWTQRLGLANRAGAVAVGQVGARDAMMGDGWVLLLASDASEGTASRFGANARRKGRPVVAASGALIGGALGREFVSVAVVGRAPFADVLGRWAAALGTYPNTPIGLVCETDGKVDRGKGGSNVV